MAVTAYRVNNEPPKWLRDRAEFFILCGYSAKRIAELLDIPEWYAQHMKDVRQYSESIRDWKDGK